MTNTWAAELREETVTLAHSVRQWSPVPLRERPHGRLVGLAKLLTLWRRGNRNRKGPMQDFHYAKINKVKA